MKLLLDTHAFHLMYVTYQAPSPFQPSPFSFIISAQFHQVVAAQAFPPTPVQTEEWRVSKR
jgi:hypothetical protein